MTVWNVVLNLERKLAVLSVSWQCENEGYNMFDIIKIYLLCEHAVSSTDS